ncbi:MAG: flagellar hook-basal body protein [Phycisphaerae bacterium]|nr:MAG: flagellar hook-basal body protein [Phycisphaerae bacterium]MBE7455616.1 flagellar hook-basal body protein [Planctomycetia bacterium]MCK6463253.1 flagellar hook-basal body protein [Phycisphaerae bacterium]MCL4716873.1 flagellar hook-basal body protein [Phycisphaerae bacterium]NUQ08490.1 flagellar hook-basal body protein [Phycisphaerae bacterium]
MIYGLYLSTAGMEANEYRQNVLANNLANAETYGFKHDLAVFSQRPTASRVAPGGMRFVHPVLDGMSGGLTTKPTYHAHVQGSIEHTDQPLDVAIEGDGFFAIRDGDRVRFTRDGRMTFNADGEMVLAAGGGRLRVLDQGGAPIRRIEGGPEARIDGDGVVRQGDLEIGRLGVTSFADLDRLTKVGRNLFEAGDEPAIPPQGRIIPQALERSTFDPVTGLVSMIEAQRAYELNARVLSLQDESMGEAINRVGRVA